MKRDIARDHCTSDSAAPVSNWLVLRFLFYGVLILQSFLATTFVTIACSLEVFTAPATFSALIATRIDKKQQ